MMERFFVCSRPHYGQLVLLISLLLGAYNLFFEAVPNSTAYLIGDPQAELGQTGPGGAPGLFSMLSWLYVGASILWLLGWGIAWTPLAATLSLTLATGLYLQSQSYVSHSFQICNQIVWVHCLWYLLYRKKIQDSRDQGVFWSSEVYPRWVLTLSVLVIAVFYGLAGFNKIRYHGLLWFDGLNFQLFVHLFGDQSSQLSQAILESRSLAKWGQYYTVLAELGAFLAVFRILRVPVGLALLGLHLGIWLAFGWPFLANAVLICLILFPWQSLAVRLGPSEPATE